MASLEEQLLNDFGDVSGSEDGAEEELGDEEQELRNEMEVEGAGTEREDIANGDNGAKASTTPGSKDLRNANTLLQTLRPVLDEIDRYRNKPSENFIGSLEENPEFRLLGQANTHSTSIDNELVTVHKYIRDHYSVRFPELETLVTNAIDYCKTVAIIGNGPMSEIKAIAASSDNPVGQPLTNVLTGPSLMVVSIEAATTQGQELSEKELAQVQRACDIALQLEKAKVTLTDYVQSRLSIFAPNLTALVGSLTAAQLMNYAGGLIGLAKTPSCNLAPLGSKKQSGMGLATNVGVRHQGFLYESPIIRDIPTDLKKQAMRMVSAKVVLAARIDQVHSSPDGTSGQELKEECLRKLEKLTEAPANKGVRALPAPDDKPSRKRGGRRARKAKEATAQTELARDRNRMAFGKEEQEVGYGTGEGTAGLGMVGQRNDGRIRAPQIDQRTKAKLSKKNAGWGGPPTGGIASSLRTMGAGGQNHGLRTSGVGASGAATSGTASTIAFTPVQGLELVDPRIREEMNKKRKADEDRWFKGGTFSQIGGTQTGSSTKVDASGFKIPSLPPRKRQDTKN
ncbi:Nop domain-containing protein [Pseudovirgaria hyperparasitica]|uniref:Nop domain-containing protein n=1 Tax=Pseudovirgaria hyperparasitica TaxID=470096 RepID=A0A6A6WHX9_9PEZI|nr:Nop domain-containing protein [Pseudovirgaria hyperparasitica]KAF2761684.1 Nop domain-containing protein [Pseudovirgaria hyperparasitica]